MFEEIMTVLFDFDGTLVQLNLDFPRIYNALYQLMTEYGLDSTPYKDLYLVELIEEATSELKGINHARATQFNGRAEGILRAHEIQEADKAKIIPGAPKTLEELKSMGLKIGIITRNCREAVERALRRGNFLYDLLSTRDDVRPVKPEPQSLQAALRTLKSKPSQALMVGDHPMDIIAGKRAGTGTVALLSGKKKEEDFADVRPDLILSQVSDLVGYFKNEK